MSLRIAVIGVGHLGKHHARILAALPGVELVAVVDINAARAQEIAAANGSTALTDYRELLGKVDAVTLAVPTERHRDIALPFLTSGVHVLVEKPMARSLVEADDMIHAAARAGSIVAVGQTERFNPAVAAARPLLADPRFIEVHRLGTFPERSLDIDVVFDLMIHDVDIVLSLVKSEVEAIEAVGVPVLTGRVDIANARLKFANGCIANLTASRISRDRVRKTGSSSRRRTCRSTTRRRNSRSGGWSRGPVPRRRSKAGKCRSRTKNRSSANWRTSSRRSRPGATRWSAARTAAAPSRWRHRSPPGSPMPPLVNHEDTKATKV